MGNFLGGDTVAKNVASQMATETAELSSEVSVNSTMTCGTINEIDLQSNCVIIDSDITQEGTCTINNDSTQNTTIQNSITQSSKQSLAQTAKAEGQNFSLNAGNINATNIGNQSVSLNSSINNKIQQTCTANALNKNLVTCEGGSLVHSQIHQTTATDMMQKCIQNTDLTNSVSQKIVQAITQKSTAIRKDAISAVLFAAAALILSVGVASKLGAGKVIRYILIFFCALAIIAIVSMFTWNIISSKDFNKPYGIEKSNTPGDYCSDVSIFTHNRPVKVAPPSPNNNVSYYKDALGCVSIGGNWYNEDGEETKGYSTQAWLESGPAPPEGTEDWNPKLDSTGTQLGYKYNPQCLVYDDGTPATEPLHQCWAGNVGMSSDLYNIKDSRTTPIGANSLSMFFSSPNSIYPVGTVEDTKIIFPEGQRDYNYWKNLCVANKCLWIPQTLDWERPDGKGIILSPTNGEVGISLRAILRDGLPEYSYAMSTLDFPNNKHIFNSPAHFEQAVIQGGYSTDYAHVDVPKTELATFVLPVAQRYDPTINIDQLYNMFQGGTDIIIPMQTLVDNSSHQAYNLFPFCTGNRELIDTEGGADSGDPTGYTCSKDHVDKQKNKKYSTS